MRWLVYGAYGYTGRLVAELAVTRGERPVLAGRDPARLVPLGRYPVGPGEAYGMCLWTRKRDGALFGFVVLKDGRIDQVSIDLPPVRDISERVWLTPAVLDFVDVVDAALQAGPADEAARVAFVEAPHDDQPIHDLPGSADR